MVRFLSLSTGGEDGEAPAVRARRRRRRPPNRARGPPPLAGDAPALTRLPPGQRAVLVLAKFEGLAAKEIAATLGITEGAVESRLVRAMRTLQRAQEAQGHGFLAQGGRMERRERS